MNEDSEMEPADTQRDLDKQRIKIENLVGELLDNSAFCDHQQLKEVVEKLMADEQGLQLQNLLQEFGKAVVWNTNKNSSNFKVVISINLLNNDDCFRRKIGSLNFEHYCMFNTIKII